MDLPEVPDGLLQTMHELVFSEWDAEFVASPAAKRGIDDVVFARFHHALTYAIPWITRAVDLSDKMVVEVGCGSGSSTVALAMNSRAVVGVDIDEKSVLAARARCEAYGVDNVDLHAVAPEFMLDVAGAVPDPDLFVLYAVLEHQTVGERLDTLRTLWSRLPPGGHLVVIETPNRLVYQDLHTTELPFYHLLPDALAFEYLDRVPRDAFRITMAEVLRDAPSEASEKRTRWGLGASFHEFELGIDEPLSDVVICDGLEPETVGWFGIGADEDLLARFMLASVPDVPIGFSRSVLNVILRKPRDEADRHAARQYNAARRDEVAARFVQPQQESAPTEATRVVACVVSFNRLPQLTVAIERLLAEPLAAIVVVDNGSTDGTREWLATVSDARLDVVLSDVNGGGAGGFEMATRHAVAHHNADWLLLQDDDAMPEPGVVSQFLASLPGPDVGGVASAVLTPSGEICEINRPGLNPFGSIRGIVRALTGGRAALHVTDDAYSAELTDVDCVSFVGYFVRATVTHQVGFPRGELFIYSDDQLYSHAIRRAGLRNVFTPHLRYVHDTTSRSDAGYFSPVWKVYFLYRNNIELYRTMAGPWFGLVMLWKLPVWVARVRYYPNRRAYLRMMRLGVTDGLRRKFARTLLDVQSFATGE